MASKDIEFRISTLIESLKESSKKDAELLCKNEVNFLMSKYSVNYAMTLITEYRKAVSIIDKSFGFYLSVDKSIMYKRLLDGKKNQNKRGKNMKKVNNWRQMIEVARSLLDSEKYAEIALGLCLLTGRRLTEILKTAKFTNYKKRAYMLNFDGQLKKKGGSVRYPVYTLGDSAKDCKIALSRLRAILDTSELTNKQVERKYHTNVNQKATPIFGKHIGRCSAHDLRAVYAAICSELYRPATINDNIFLGGLLGHNWEDTDTANAYKKYIL